jgi:hypothetical protein
MAICSSHSATVLCRAAVVPQDLHLRPGICFFGIPVPGREFRVPYGRPTGTAPRRPGPCPAFPCSARVRYDRGGCLLYSGAVVSSRSAMGLRSAPAVSQRPAVSSASHIPPAEVTITKHAEIHLHSPVRSSPRPPSPDGTVDGLTTRAAAICPSSRPAATRDRTSASRGQAVGSGREGTASGAGPAAATRRA